jgi:hypothetical protein
VKTKWAPTLTSKQALTICGSLSNPSKMPGHGRGNKFGWLLAFAGISPLHASNESLDRLGRSDNSNPYLFGCS